MSIKFAEQILDSMVDENGHCGERGLSAKQFTILSEYLIRDEEAKDEGCWRGDYRTIEFISHDFRGNIGKYRVVLNELLHFNMRYTVVSIDLRDTDEYQAELDEEARMRELRDFSNSEWVAEPKKRLDLTLTLVNDYMYEGCSYSYYDNGIRHIYTFRDEQGNCFVWKTSKVIDWYDEGADEFVDAKIGSVITMKATVKEHGEYKGIKQTIINRPKVLAIA